jgi:hypothetical protein
MRRLDGFGLGWALGMTICERCSDDIVKDTTFHGGLNKILTMGSLPVILKHMIPYSKKPI